MLQILLYEFTSTNLAMPVSDQNAKSLIGPISTAVRNCLSWHFGFYMAFVQFRLGKPNEKADNSPSHHLPHGSYISCALNYTE